MAWPTAVSVAAPRRRMHHQRLRSGPRVRCPCIHTHLCGPRRTRITCMVNCLDACGVVAGWLPCAAQRVRMAHAAMHPQTSPGHHTCSVSSSSLETGCVRRHSPQSNQARPARFMPSPMRSTWKGMALPDACPCCCTCAHAHRPHLALQGGHLRLLRHEHRRRQHARLPVQGQP